jgi:hypothetical protein
VSRLYDRILVNGVISLRGLRYKPVNWQRLREATKLVVDNVTEFYFAVDDKEVWDLLQDFPCLAPPFDNFWVETNRASRIVSRVYGIQSTAEHARAWGGHFTVHEMDRVRDPYARWLRQQDSPWEGPAPDAKWIVNVALFVEWEKGQIYGPAGLFSLELDEAGRAVELPGEQTRLLLITPTQNAPELTDGFLKPLLLGISFMHCQNVSQVPVTPPPKLSRAHERRHKIPLTRYHVLNIEPFKAAAKRQGGGHSGTVTALHIRRGHFKHYTADRPLFGRHTGTWFWPQRLVGEVSEGTVVKDYRLDLAGVGR